MENNSLNFNSGHKLIITIVKRGMSEKVITATKAVGAEGGTIFLGKGSTRESIYNILGMNYEPDKDIIFTYVREEIAENVLEAVRIAANLDKAGTGISFIIKINRMLGIYHLLFNNNSKGEIKC